MRPFRQLAALHQLEAVFTCDAEHAQDTVTSKARRHFETLCRPLPAPRGWCARVHVLMPHCGSACGDDTPPPRRYSNPSWWPW